MKNNKYLYLALLLIAISYSISKIEEYKEREIRKELLKLEIQKLKLEIEILNNIQNDPSTE